MLFLLLFTVVALGAVTVVCLPLLRGVPLVAERGYFDRMVYRDQLKEVDRDVARGVLSPAEAGSARLEIQRRLLAVDAPGSGPKVRSEPSPRLAAMIGVLLLAGGTGLYLHYGAPSLPDAPFAGGASAQGQTMPNGAPHVDMAQAAKELQQKLQSNPNDPDGWVLLGRTESMLGNWQQASEAYSHALALGQKTPDVYAGYGEMLVMATGGIVSPGAHDAFAHALMADPKNDVARYYLALADAQAGEDRRAIERWQALAAELPDDSPMRDAIGRGIADAAKDAGIPVPAMPKGVVAEQQQPAEAQPGPNDAQMAGAAQMPPAQQQDMIKSMVAKLAAHLQANPNDLAGWLQLARSYGVLGESAKATAAFEKAASLKPDDPSIPMQEFHALIADLQPTDKLPPAAVELLHKVAAMAPDQPEVLWYLGVEATQNGKPDVARADWTTLLSQLPPGGEDAKLVKTALDALPK